MIPLVMEPEALLSEATAASYIYIYIYVVICRKSGLIGKVRIGEEKVDVKD
jgi:hypothetical protein